jgi:hypothetical protein
MTSREVAKSVDPSVLEELGKSAARLGETSRISLTEAVVQKIASRQLTSEQVRRVVEACNIEAVNRKYASMSGSNRIVHIDGGPADPVQVLQSVKAASLPAPTRIEAFEYGTAPVTEKRASLSAAPAVPVPSLPELRDKLAAAHAEVTSQFEASSFLMEESLGVLKEAAYTAHLEGATLAELCAAWSSHSEVLAKVAARQLQGTIPWGKTAADRSINPDHRAVSAFRDFAKYAQRFYQESKARMDIEEQLRRVETHLRRTSS